MVIPMSHSYDPWTSIWTSHCFIRTTAEFSAFAGELACSITQNSTYFLGQKLLGSHSFSHHFRGFLPDTPSFSPKNSRKFHFPRGFSQLFPRFVGGSSTWSWAPWASWRCRPRVPPGRGTPRGWEGSTRRSALVKSPRDLGLRGPWVIKCPHFSHHPTIRY